MGRLKKSLTSLFFIFTLSSCTNIGFTTIKNATDEELVIKVIFDTEHGAHAIIFEVKAGQYNGWKYENSYFYSSKIDEKLSSIEISNVSGCLLTLSLKDINKKIQGGGVNCTLLLTLRIWLVLVVKTNNNEFHIALFF